jgi:two-component system, cell cycle sensor histidine kinase and response regulator CckA
MKYLWSALLFFLTFFTLSQSWASDPNIVIINSYHYGQEWAHAELTGFMEVLHSKYPQSRPPVEYLDTNRFGSKKSLQKVAAFLIDKYAGKKTDLVIALDNPALNLVLDNRGKLFPEAPIVFAGINDYRPEMLRGRDKITGIAEVADNKGSIEIILKINPQTRHILILNDNTITGKALHRDLEPFLGLFNGNPEISFYYPATFEEAREKINSLSEGTAVLIASLVADSSGKTLPTPESTLMMTSENRIPVYAMRESRLGHGIVGGMLLSGTEHGRRAGQIALRVLAGEDPSSIPVETSAHSIPMFDYKVMERLGIPLDRLPAGSIVINRQLSFFEAHKTPILYALGIIVILSIAIFVLLINIMRRRQAEKQLLDLSRYTSALFEDARDALFVADPETGIILDANRAAQKLLKKPKSDLIGMHQTGLHTPENSAKSVETFRQQSQGLAIISETDIINSEGGKIPVEISPSLIELPGGKRVLLGSFRDISDRNKLQEQLLHSQKMEAIGTLAGGVAHEFNNALTSIIGAADLLRLERVKQGRLEYLTDIILKSSARAARLTQSLLSFCRKDVASPLYLDINELLSDQEQFFSKLIGEDILILQELSEAPCIVFADPGQIEQIIMNIALNARDAMPNGGRLEICTELVKGREIPEETSDAIKEADYVLMSFKDTGCGIGAEIRAKIFEPFFTTKEVGKGTGLGLSIVYGLVMQNNGFIDIKSAAGKGTEFRIFLPFKAARIKSARTKSNYAGKHSEVTGNVLLAEDDSMLMRMQSLILKAAGYRVFAAWDGHEAIDIFRKNIDEIDFVVLDVVMPGMNGKEVYDEIRKLRPETKILLVSGHTDDFITSKGIIQDKVDFLAKPFTPAQLRNKIREMMQR